MIKKPFNYGGQAVMEGVMMRGSKAMAVAVRHPEGHIVVHQEPLSKFMYDGWLTRAPLLRGLVLLWDSLGLGMRSLFSLAISPSRLKNFKIKRMTSRNPRPRRPPLARTLRPR